MRYSELKDIAPDEIAQGLSRDPLIRGEPLDARGARGGRGREGEGEGEEEDEGGERDEMPDVAGTAPLPLSYEERARFEETRWDRNHDRNAAPAPMYAPAHQ